MLQQLFRVAFIPGNDTKRESVLRLNYRKLSVDSKVDNRFIVNVLPLTFSEPFVEDTLVGLCLLKSCDCELQLRFKLRLVQKS